MSARAALRSASTETEREAVQDRFDALLVRLEEIVIRDGGNEEILAAIEAARRGIQR